MPRSDGGPVPAYRGIPAVSSLLERSEVAALTKRYSREFVTDLVREAVEILRRSVATGDADEESVRRFSETLSARLEEIVERRLGGRTVPVLNATGVIVHTNLGRSPLSTEATARMVSVAQGYCDLEYDSGRGERGSRLEHVDALLQRLFPATRGIVVNNNAGAVLLALNTFAEGREVLVSRGELVEIGGSFRIPDVMGKSGGILREVGTTNRTRIEDFERALTEASALLLKVHTSNYRIIGFTEEAPLGEMAALGRARGLPVIVDQGSGNLLDLTAFGLRDEPTVGSLLEQGADLVTFSGDKLLGGPQAGIAVGRPDLVGRMKANAMYRALRPDKTTVAALEATLESFVAGNPLEEIPTLRMLSLPARTIEARSRRLAADLAGRAGERLEMRVEEGVSRVGGGAAPMEDVATYLLAVRPRASGVEALEERLRLGRPAVVARVREGWLVLDLRTIQEEMEPALLQALVLAAS